MKKYKGSFKIVKFSKVELSGVVFKTNSSVQQHLKRFINLIKQNYCFIEFCENQNKLHSVAIPTKMFTCTLFYILCKLLMILGIWKYKHLLFMLLTVKFNLNMPSIFQSREGCFNIFFRYIGLHLTLMSNLQVFWYCTEFLL